MVQDTTVSWWRASIGRITSVVMENFLMLILGLRGGKKHRQPSKVRSLRRTKCTLTTGRVFALYLSNATAITTRPWSHMYHIFCYVAINVATDLHRSAFTYDLS